ncbi:stalk domain-containing protein [Paenibacillus amylolyticus]|uniref:stalk domain-containing protein n=1 Tax=Paenibacillus TaxID=44249 RepID=UPI00105974E8|nr:MULTISPECIES: stalk domain-containing protein [Paenibacillus]TDL70563.1 copper amine oxidase [Paenibacillus amylolyticus]UOK62468.1 stalk domain-containing protein [Paenibacillus sp. OVF10]WJM07018.1 stalk domain-containing protein [Paenibacillus sp. PK1-4R]
MKKYLAGLLIIFFLCLGLPGQAYMEVSNQQPLAFEDLNLEQALKSFLNKNDDESLTKEDLESLTDVSLSGKGIKSLQGLEYAVNVTKLSLSRNQIADISPLSDAVNLTTLDLSGNQIEDIKPLGKLTKLTDLSVSRNQFNDLSALTGLVNLNTLSISSNKITDLKSLAGLVNLWRLDAANNNIKDLTPLSKLTNLLSLDLSSNQIYDLEPLRNLQSLAYLYLNNNRVWDLEPIQQRSFFPYYDTGAFIEPLALQNNYLDLSKGSKTYKLFVKLAGNELPSGQRKTQRLVIGSTTAYVGESAYRIIAAPFIKTGRTYVPIRFISEKLGATVNWNQSTKEVTIQKDGKTIRWAVGNRQVKVNQQTVMQDASLLLKNGSAFVPVRFVAEQLNTSVEYMGSKHMVLIFKN